MIPEEVMAKQAPGKEEHIQVKAEVDPEPVVISDEEVEETTPAVMVPLVVTAHLAPENSLANDWRTVRTAEDNLRKRTSRSKNRHQDAGSKRLITGQLQEKNRST